MAAMRQRTQLGNSKASAVVIDTAFATQQRSFVTDIVANLRLFRNVPRPLLADLAALVEPQRVSRGTLILRRGAIVDGVHAIAHGTVKLALRGNGDERVLRLAGGGDTFCDATCLLRRPSSVDAVALTDALLIVIPPAAIERLIVRDANFAHTIVEHLAQRVLAFVGEIEANVLRSGMQRVAAYLDELAAPADGEWIVQLPTTKKLVASRLGMKKETLSRLLRDLSARNAIVLRGRDVIVPDRERLRAIAGAPAWTDRCDESVRQ
jgi:CRP-like cAMP-binding protein